MPNIATMTDTKFLKKEDFEKPTLLTFREFRKMNVARNNEPPEHKWVAFFKELDKPLVLNKTNLKRAASAMGSDNTDDWIGRQIVAYNDPDVEFGGESIGGVRLRAPKADKNAPVPPKAAATADFDDDIPFSDVAA